MSKPNASHPGRGCNCLGCKRQREADRTGIAGGFATLAVHEALERDRRNARRRATRRAV